MVVRQLIAFRCEIDGDYTAVMEDAEKECRFQEKFWRSYRIDYRAYPAVMPTQGVPSSYMTREMLNLAEREYPEIAMTHYQLHETDDSEGQRGGRFSRVRANDDKTTGAHETGHNILSRFHAGNPTAPEANRKYADDSATIMAGGRYADGRLGLSAADLYFAGLLEVADAEGP